MREGEIYGIEVLFLLPFPPNISRAALVQIKSRSGETVE
jgi:hypothetical protein